VDTPELVQPTERDRAAIEQERKERKKAYLKEYYKKRKADDAYNDRRKTYEKRAAIDQERKERDRAAIEQERKEHKKAYMKEYYKKRKATMPTMIAGSHMKKEQP
jgi:superfamily II DNA or RNA helicase